MKPTLTLLTALLLAPLLVSDAEAAEANIGETSASAAPLIAADYILPAYVNLPSATLLVRATGAFQGSPVELRVAFQPRQGGEPPRGEMRTTLKPGEERRLTVDIAGWADGDYRTGIQCSREGQQLGEPLVRWLRKQTIPAPPPAPEPIDVRSLTTLFVDDAYIHAQNGLRRAVHPAETFAVTTGRMEPDRPIQKASQGIQLEPDGTWIVKFTDEEREDRTGATTRHYTARSRDARTWKVTGDPPAGRHPNAKSTPKNQATKPSVRPVQLLAAAPASDPSPPRFRFYDAATDGPVNIQQVRLRHTGVTKNVRWGEIAMPYRAVFPVWQKSPAEHLILAREPLLQDKHDQPDGAPCDWRDTNDNYLNDFHSPDGRTMFYGQARMILRHDPFRIPFDAFKTFPGGNYNRIMTVWRSQDGLHWTPTFFDPQQEDDPFSYQGYGAQQFYVEGKRLSLCYFFAYRAEFQQVCVELRYSRDNIHWQRLPGRLEDNIFAANGPWGSWNFGYMHGMIGAPVEKDGEMLHLFASCQNVPHHFFRSLLGYNAKAISDPEWLKAQFKENDLPRYPFWKEMGGWEGFARFAPQACRPVGGVRYRKDGWVALKPIAQEGELLTKVLLAGEHLAINARTRPGGRVRVEVLDAESRPLPGFSGANAATFTGDSVNARLSWQNGAHPTLPGQPVRLRIRLDRADLFALHFSPAPATPAGSKSPEDAPGPVIRVSPASGEGTGEPAGAAIQRALDSLRRSGGTLVLEAGVYHLGQTLLLSQSQKSIAIRGEPGAKLVMDVAPRSSLSREAAAGVREIELTSPGGFHAGAKLEIPLADPGKFFEPRVRKATGALLEIDRPVPTRLAAGTPVTRVENVLELSDGVDNVSISGLDIDLQRSLQPLTPHDHTRHCGILVQGRYAYDTGPASLCRRIQVRNCVIRNATQRGIALYATVDSEVSGCRIENTGAEAIDVDHFCRRIRVERNVLQRGDLTGIELNDASDCLVRQNEITGYPAGIKIWNFKPCRMDQANTGNRIESNVIRSPKTHGIWLDYEVKGNRLIGNIIEGQPSAGKVLVLEPDNEVK